jgi:hypothetical protein
VRDPVDRLPLIPPPATTAVADRPERPRPPFPLHSDGAAAAVGRTAVAAPVNGLVEPAGPDVFGPDLHGARRTVSPSVADSAMPFVNEKNCVA